MILSYSARSVRELQIQAARDFNHEEEQYLRELNLIIHVFRRRFEAIFQGTDKVMR